MERRHSHLARCLSPRPQLPSRRSRKRIQLGKSSHPTRNSSSAPTTSERPTTVAHHPGAHTKIIGLSHCHGTPKRVQKGLRLHAGVSPLSLARLDRGRAKRSSFGQLSLFPLRIPFSPSAPLLDRNDVWRSEPTIALPLPRRSPILLWEDQLTPEGMLIPDRRVLAHDLLFPHIFTTESR